jgi:DNA-binding GntR family transcriptional regulator
LGKNKRLLTKTKSHLKGHAVGSGTSVSALDGLDALSWIRNLQVIGVPREGTRDQSRANFVYEAIRSAIQTGELGRGERVREEEVAEVLGVSRTPVREALRRLQASGLLEISHRRGLSVSIVGRRQVLELFDIREVLEGAAARFAAQHASESEILLLRRLLSESLAVEEDPLKTTHLNRVFHHAIYDAAHNRYLLGSLGEVYDSMALLGKTTYVIKGRARSAHEEHVVIVEAIAARDPEKADQAARMHVAMAKQARLEIIDSEE